MEVRNPASYESPFLQWNKLSRLRFMFVISLYHAAVLLNYQTQKRFHSDYETDKNLGLKTKPRTWAERATRRLIMTQNNFKLRNLLCKLKWLHLRTVRVRYSSQVTGSVWQIRYVSIRPSVQHTTFLPTIVNRALSLLIFLRITFLIPNPKTTVHLFA